MDDPTLGDWSGLGTDVVANIVTVVLFGCLFTLKKLCSRDSKCKAKLHTCCIDVELADRTQRASQPPSVSEDEEPANRV